MRRILVVDDDKKILNFVATALVADDHEIETVEDAQTAMAMIKAGGYDIILTDKNMPGLEYSCEGGLDVLKYAKTHHPATQVIVMTGYATIESAIVAMRLGAFDYLFKPLTMKELLCAVDRAAKYQGFLAPENTLAEYRLLHDELLALVEGLLPTVGNDRCHTVVKSFDEKLDRLFATIKNRELFIIDQREALARISGYAEELAELVGNRDTPIATLIDKIKQEAYHRL